MKKILLALICLSSLAAQAQVQFGEIISAGTGCSAEDPPPRLEIEDGKGVISISSLNVVASSRTTSLINREACNIRLQASVAKGYQLGIRISDIVGSLNQDKGVQTTVAATAGLVMKQNEQSLSVTYAAKVKGRLKISNQTDQDSFSWTDCSGAKTLLALSASSSSVRSKTSAKVNSSIKAVNFEVVVRECQ